MARSRLPVLIVLAAFVPGLQAQNTGPAPAKKLYCWNEGGRRICGDALPADAVNAPRTEYAVSGQPRAQVGRALTADERAAADAEARAERAAADAVAAEHRRLMAMVESFATEDDLRRAFGSRIELNRGSIKTAKMSIDGLRQALVHSLRRAGEAELARRPVPKKLADDIRVQHGQLRLQQAQLARLERDADLIQAQLDEAVTRYRDIKGKAATTGAPSAPAAAG